MNSTVTNTVIDKRIIVPRVGVSVPISTTPIRITPDFDAFAANHRWIGQKMGKLQNFSGGFGQQYQAATLYGAYGGDPFEVHGPIRDKYNQFGGPNGILGFPTTNQTATPDGKGQFNHFEKGSIYWHPALGAFELHGAIRGKWISLGWENYGYPLTDESPTIDGVGRFNHFRAFFADGTTADRSIYWSPETGAQDVRDGIRNAWSELGWETSFLGYPVSGEYDIDGGRRSDFQNGNIAWTPGMGVQVQPQRVMLNSNIVFESGYAVGGYANLAIFSDGTTHLWGHLHDSGSAPYDCVVVLAIVDGDGRAYAASKTGTVHGTWDPGSRNLDWDEWGTNNEIRQNWTKIWARNTGGCHAEVSSDWTFERIAAFVGKIAGAAAAVLALSAAIIAFIALIGGGSAKKSADANYGPPEAYPPGGLPPPDAGIQTIAT